MHSFNVYRATIAAVAVDIGPVLGCISVLYPMLKLSFHPDYLELLV